MKIKMFAVEGKELTGRTQRKGERAENTLLHRF